ncbi:MAG TPA: hypothetical protein VIH57_14650 [Bacteroidales bacterium]
MKKILIFSALLLTTVITHAQEVNLATLGIITSCNISTPSPGGTCNEMGNLIDGSESTGVNFVPEYTGSGGDGMGSRYYKLQIDLKKPYNISSFMVKTTGSGLHIGGVAAGVNADSLLFEDEGPNLRILIKNTTFYNLSTIRTRYLTFLLDDNGASGTLVNIQEIYIFGNVTQFSQWTTNGSNIYFNGNIGIGITDPGSYKLNVAGRVRANEIVVNTTGADFVFEPTYKLRPLAEVETYIKANKHLPDVAPATDMQTNGVCMGDMQAKLLQKVEELTLYVIEQNKKITNQENKIKELQKEIVALKKK